MGAHLWRRLITIRQIHLLVMWLVGYHLCHRPSPLLSAVLQRAESGRDSTLRFLLLNP
jgi:hypothetical protein